jgi:hypothetical protein
MTSPRVLGDPRPALALILAVAVALGVCAGVYLSRCVDVDVSAEQA